LCFSGNRKPKFPAFLVTERHVESGLWTGGNFGFGFPEKHKVGSLT
jgi:hypothetical protein